MTEDYLHYVWRQKQIEIQGLQTTAGQDLEVVSSGTQNFDSGPDFQMGEILISGQKWVGNIEIHLKASDWFRHGHQHDPAYESVILHVVYEADQEVQLSNGEVIPTLELKGILDEYPYWRYEQLVQSKGFIPCQPLWSSVNSEKRTLWIQRMGVERFQKWSDRIGDSVSSMDSPETWAYHWVARALGLTKNSEPMLELARRIPLSMAKRHADRQDQLLALFLGTAGWLNEKPADEYQRTLKREFDHLRVKYSLTPMEPVQWKTFRLRPGSLPILRIV
ncbi:MAG: DUF2851 family protein, partial [Bacteroidota bacterium]|nr:DUF2851 family protein [Bacteroidota bacterium]MDX5426699.1 DUF2851 family protein [Bacteroidota bacterium]